MFYRRVTYGHFKVGPGFATIAGARLGDRLYYGITFCSPEDNFSKKVGRAKSSWRLSCDPRGCFRGVLRLDGEIDKVQPAIVLKRAVEYYLSKETSRRPQWTKGATVEFRGKRRTVGEVADWSGLQ